MRRIFRQVALSLTLSSSLFLMHGGMQVQAKESYQPIYTRPVKLDESGRPLYNSWELQEIQRRANPRSINPRHSQTNENKSQNPPASQDSSQQQSVQPNTKDAGSSAIQTNPPMQKIP
jgi:hypothetical protein